MKKVLMSLLVVAFASSTIVLAQTASDQKKGTTGSTPAATVKTTDSKTPSEKAPVKKAKKKRTTKKAMK